jgi:hypothetical protein
MNLRWYKKNWRRLELANGRSPATGRPLRRAVTAAIEFDPPTPEDWGALARYTKFINRGVDHRTAYFQAGYGDDDRESEALMASWQLDGLLVVDYSQQR